MTAMHIDLKAGELRTLRLSTGESITLTLQRKSGQQARLLLEIPPEIRIEPHGGKPQSFITEHGRVHITKE